MTPYYEDDLVTLYHGDTGKGRGWASDNHAGIANDATTAARDKPTDVMCALISHTTGVVADPFAGSGSTLFAAKYLGRKSIGVELEEKYCEIAANRLTQESPATHDRAQPHQTQGGLVPQVVTPPEVRFWAKVNKNAPPPEAAPGLGGCWLWEAGCIKQGYGAFHPSKTTFELAHRWAFKATKGEIPTGLVLDHLCRNRKCVNPEHLEPVSNEENLRRGAGYGLRNGMRNLCRNGHAYTAENTYTDPTKGTVRCRACARHRDRMRTRKSRSK